MSYYFSWSAAEELSDYSEVMANSVKLFYSNFTAIGVVFFFKKKVINMYR